MKIAIEGMDGVGKSTIAKKIAKSLGYVYLDKPLKELFQTEKINGEELLSIISNKIYDFDEEIIKAWFFGMGNIYSFLKYKNEDLIIDRHFASNYFWNGTSETNCIFENMIDLIGVPDLTIVLYASVKTRLERIYSRNSNDYDLKDAEKHVDGYDKILNFLNSFSVPHVFVNTENKTEDEVYTEVKDIINKYKEKPYGKVLKK